jgi:short-subunit dehydrogenase involved in D-alanine esterification of teichoic acids
LAAVAHASPDIGCVRVDLDDPSSIQRFCQEVADQRPSLNFVRNNAGLQQVEEIDAVLAG